MPVTGTELTHDSRDFLDLPEIPKSMIMIRAGFIGMEFTLIAQAAGSDVTIVEYADRALAKFDADYTNRVVELMTAKGIKFAFIMKLNRFHKTVIFSA